MMFNLLSRGGYGTFGSKAGGEKPAPCKLVARLFSNIRTATVQIQFFQLLIDKSTCYMTNPMSLKDVVLVTDMDSIIDEVVKHFGMKHYWDKRHVNQAISKKTDGRACKDIVLQRIAMLRDCDTEEAAKIQMKALENLLTFATVKQEGKSKEVVNPYYDPQIWSYLSSTFSVISIASVIGQ